MIVVPPATGVTLTPSTVSPQTFGNPVTFTAAGSSSIVLPAAAYKYRFLLNAVEVQAFSTTATWTMPGTTAVGNYTVTVEVSTEAVPVTAQATTNVPYTIVNPPATGVTLTPAVASPQNIGTPVTFTAAGSGGAVGATYRYRFLLDTVEVQAFSTTATWTMPGTTAAGTHTVRVETSTEPVPVTAQAATKSATTSPTRRRRA